jgi:hypothetical protein
MFWVVLLICKFCFSYYIQVCKFLSYVVFNNTFSICELNLSLEAQLLACRWAEVKLSWQIKPMMKVTHDIMHVTSIHYEWHEFFPHGRISVLYLNAIN